MHIKPFHHTLANFALVLAILFGTFGAGVLPAAATPQEGQKAPAQQTGDPAPPVYLPLIVGYTPRKMNVFGAETHSLRNYSGLMNEAGMYWVRNSTISWADIEPVRTNPPTYHWEKVDEAGIIAAANRGLSLVATIKDTPIWAQKVPGSYCGPVAADYLDEFAQFMAAAVRRYSVRPYRVKYWEMGNEPDVDPSLVLGDSVFGCWGDINSPFYGGEYYAQMLRNIYPAAKAADPHAQIVVGGLLLDCDWTNPPKGKDCTPSKFLEGIIWGGGGDSFDMVGFHSFANYSGYINEDSVSWLARGGTMMGKISFLRDTMARYGVDKPLLMNESSMVCPDWMRSECTPPVSNKFLETQANYVSWLYVRAIASDVKGVIWYTIEDSGWRSSGLSTQGEPKPAYRALQFTSSILDGATYAVQISSYQSVQGYAFYKDGGLLWVLWSADQVDHTINLPASTTKVYDKYGTVLATQGGDITINSPIYVELRP